MTTLDAIQARIKKLQDQADALIAKQSSTVIKKIHELMALHGITTADLELRTDQQGKKVTVRASSSANVTGREAKYRDPKSGATWSGFGRAPGWIANAKDRSKFLIDGTEIAPTQKSTASRVAEKGGQKKGPRPALYRDPKTGSTWSGLGRTPSWIASARDRTRFLIGRDNDAADNSGVGQRELSSKAGAQKKPRVMAVKAVQVAAEPAKKTRAVQPAKSTVSDKPAKRVGAKKAVAKKVSTARASNTTPSDVTQTGVAETSAVE
jgi:DNA-binding protein H-NS